jgi:hypothetical protein
MTTDDNKPLSGAGQSALDLMLGEMEQKREKDLRPPVSTDPFPFFYNPKPQTTLEHVEQQRGRDAIDKLLGRKDCVPTQFIDRFVARLATGKDAWLEFQLLLSERIFVHGGSSEQVANDSQDGVLALIAERDLRETAAQSPSLLGSAPALKPAARLEQTSMRVDAIMQTLPKGEHFTIIADLAARLLLAAKTQGTHDFAHFMMALAEAVDRRAGELQRQNAEPLN